VREQFGGPSCSRTIWSTTWLALKFQLGVVDPQVSIVWRFLMVVTIIIHQLLQEDFSPAEFFVTAAISAAFVASVGVTLWPIVAGLEPV